MNKMKKILMFFAVFTTCFAYEQIFGNTSFATMDRSERHVFYNFPLNKLPYNKGPEASFDNNKQGIEYFVRFQGENKDNGDKDNGDVEYSSKNWNTNAPWANYELNKSYSTVGNSADTFDYELCRDMKAIGEIKNTTNEEQEMEFRIYFQDKIKDKKMINLENNSKPIILQKDSKLFVQYLNNNKEIVDGKLNNVDHIWIKGKMQPKEVVKLNVPLNTENLKDNDYMAVTIWDIKSYLDGTRPDNTTSRLRASKFLYNVDDKIKGKYVGTTLEGNNKYKIVPDEIQKIMPDIKREDLIYSTAKKLYTPGKQIDLTYPSDGAAYPFGKYYIKTERIFDAVKDHGYSVNWDETRGLWNAYSYDYTPNAKLENDVGQPVETGKVDNNTGVYLSDYYVELHRVLDTKDIKLKVGKKWDKWDNLIHTERIDNKNKKLEKSKIEVEHNVDTNKRGTYYVKYTYKIPGNDDFTKGKAVSKTAKVTVYSENTGGGGSNHNNGAGTSKKYVILANGSKYTDVLTATVLANEKKCPILLSKENFVSENTINEIKRLGVDEVIIAGGPDSVSEKVVKSIKDLGFDASRIWGHNRYQTARKIGDEVRKTNYNKEEMILVDGTNFPDVITFSSLANYKRIPIMITEPKKFNTVAEKSLNDWKIKNVIIGGEKNSVSNEIQKDVASKVKNVERIGGRDRYVTAYKLANRVRDVSGNRNDTILVDGTNFPDGITVSSLSAKFNAPILLTTPNHLPSVSADAIKYWKINNMLFTGGTNSISPQLYDSIKVKNKQRIAGKDRYDTAVMISKKYTSNEPFILNINK